MSIVNLTINHSILLNRLPDNSSNSETIHTQTIGNFNVFETDSLCEAVRVGDNNVLETKGIITIKIKTVVALIIELKNLLTGSNWIFFFCTAKVSKGVELTNGCVIGPACLLLEPEIIPENTIVYGTQCHRREMNDKPYVRKI